MLCHSCVWEWQLIQMAYLQVKPKTKKHLLNYISWSCSVIVQVRVVLKKTCCRWQWLTFRQPERKSSSSESSPLTLMITVTDNSPFQDYSNPDDHTTRSAVIPGFKPFTVKYISLNYRRSYLHVLVKLYCYLLYKVIACMRRSSYESTAAPVSDIATSPG